MSNEIINIWKKIIVGEEKSWVLFENGTIVILMEPEPDLRNQAISLMEEYGRVSIGTPAGDFSVINLSNDEGYAVTCHHPDILTYVSAPEVEENADDWKIGFVGRSKRDADAHELEIIHIENNHKSQI